MSSCPKCGKDAPAGALVCEHDGAPLVTLAGAVPAAKSPSNELLAPGSMVGEYRIVALLGEGGFGAVYRAEHPVIGKSAAIKVVKREFGASAEMTSRFVSEARAVNQIRHRNIIDIFNFGNLDDGRPYYVMELLDGSTLDALLEDRGRMSFAEAQPIFRQLGRALSAAHGAGIAHRDLKPENVFVAFDEDGHPTPKLLDFGLAKLLGEGPSLHRTRSGVPMGTPLYMSPEQVYGKDVDHRTDIYAFGIIVFQTLTGELPFWGESVMEVMVKQTSAPRPSASAVCPDVPAELDEPIRRMMAKDPADRPESIAAALDALFDAAQAAGIATSGSGLARLPEPSRRSDAGDVRPSAVGSSSGARARSAGSSGGSGERTAQASSTAGVSADGLATSDTLVDPRLRLASPPARSPIRAIGFGALAVLVVGGAFFAQQRLAATPAAVDGPAAAQAAGERPEPSAEVVPLAPASAVSAPAPSAGAPPPVVAPTTVLIRFDADVPGAEVRVDGRLVGLTPTSIELPRGDEPVEVEIRKAGYLTVKRSVVPAKDEVVASKLVALPPRPPRPPRPPVATPPGGGEVVF